jgi:hypothetical protein
LWPVALLLAFIYVTGPNIYRRTFPEADIPQPTGRIVWNIEQAARGRAYFLSMTRILNDESKEVRVLGFQAHGKNTSADPISQFSGYMRSTLTNAAVPIYLHAQAQEMDDSKTLACFPNPWIPTSPEETYGIPPLADFDVGTYDKPFADVNQDGVTITKFLNTFVPFSVVLEYDGAKFERKFSKEEVVRQVDLFEKSFKPLSNPHVLRRTTAKPAPLPPLRSLVPQPTPSPPAK